MATQKLVVASLLSLAFLTGCGEEKSATSTPAATPAPAEAPAPAATPAAPK